MTALYVALGGALGAIGRYGIGLAVGYPWATFSVNTIGSFAIGVIWVLLPAVGAGAHLPFLLTGLLGGFTTFSAFSLDTLRLIEDGKVFLASTYVVLSVVFSLGFCFLGLTVSRSFL